MKLVIQGVEYPLGNINEATLDDLMALRKQTGLGVKGLRQRLDAMAAIEDSEDVLDDPESLLAIGALVWLARRKAGESLTLEQACAFPLTELEFVDDEPVEDAGDVDPKSERGSNTDSTPT